MIRNQHVLKHLALFDFDGTLTSKDTLLEFIKFYKGSFRFYTGMLLLLPVLMLLKMRLVSSQYAKEAVLSHFFKGEDAASFEQSAKAFAREVVPLLIRNDAFEKLKSHLSRNDEVAIVSASPENWIRGWASPLGIKLIATKLEITQDKVSGKIAGKNCNGREKINRIKSAYDLEAFDAIHAYGNSTGDKEMLSLAHHPFYKIFK